MALTTLWGRHAKSPRLATPALRTAEVLLSRTQILSSPDDQSDLLGTGTHFAHWKQRLVMAASMHMHRQTCKAIQCKAMCWHTTSCCCHEVNQRPGQARTWF